MRSVCLVAALFAVAAPSFAQTSAQKQPSAQPKLEIVTRQGDFYWVVETDSDGSRKGGWINAQVSLDRIDRTALKPIPALPSAPDEPANAVSVNARLSRIEQALAVSQRAEHEVTTQPTTSVQSTPLPQPAQSQRETSVPVQGRPQTREGFWFNAGLGWGSVSCLECNYRVNGGSGNLSLGGTINPKWLFGVGTTGFTRSVDGETLTAGSLDARFRFYPSRQNGFFLTFGGGLGHQEFDGETAYGGAAVFGVGYDVRVGRNVSLTPYYNGVGMANSGGNLNFNQLGLGVTIH